MFEVIRSLATDDFSNHADEKLCYWTKQELPTPSESLLSET